MKFLTILVDIQQTIYYNGNCQVKKTAAEGIVEINKTLYFKCPTNQKICSYI